MNFERFYWRKSHRGDLYPSSPPGGTRALWIVRNVENDFVLMEKVGKYSLLTFVPLCLAAFMSPVVMIYNFVGGIPKYRCLIWIFLCNHSIALEVLYKVGSKSNLIRWSVRPQIDENGPGEKRHLPVTAVFGVLRLTVSSDRLGLKRLLIELEKSYRLI